MRQSHGTCFKCSLIIYIYIYIYIYILEKNGNKSDGMYIGIHEKTNYPENS